MLVFDEREGPEYLEKKSFGEDNQPLEPGIETVPHNRDRGKPFLRPLRQERGKGAEFKKEKY